MVSIVASDDVFVAVKEDGTLPQHVPRFPEYAAGFPRLMVSPGKVVTWGVAEDGAYLANIEKDVAKDGVVPALLLLLCCPEVFRSLRAVYCP